MQEHIRSQTKRSNKITKIPLPFLTPGLTNQPSNLSNFMLSNFNFNFNFI